MIVGIYENVPNLVASTFLGEEETSSSTADSQDFSNSNNEEDAFENLSAPSKKHLEKATEYIFQDFV